MDKNIRYKMQKAPQLGRFLVAKKVIVQFLV